MKPKCSLPLVALWLLLVGGPWAHNTLGDTWSTETTLSVTPSPIAPGNTMTLTSQTTGLSGGGGTVTFSVDGQVVGSSPVGTTGKATLSTTAPAVGSHTATASYGGYQLSPGGWHWVTVTQNTYDDWGNLTGSYTTSEYKYSEGTYLSASSGSTSFTAVDSPPFFTVMPTNRIVAAGYDTRFSVEVRGSVPMSYQWRLGDQPLLGDTNAVLSLPAVQPSAAGKYSVVVSNALGVVTSTNAFLTVYSVSSSLGTTQSATVVEGTAVTFTVATTGVPPLTFAWKKDGTILIGQSASTLGLPSVQPADAGLYSVAISDGRVSVEGEAGRFAVSPRPLVLSSPLRQQGRSVQFSFEGRAERVYRVEVSSDLVTWTLLTNMLGVRGPVWAIDSGISQYPKRFYRVATADAPPGMLAIPAGTFVMGSPDSETDRESREGPQTEVTLSQAFWMSKYETTQEEYLAVMGINPSVFIGDLKQPVEQVTWFDATNYCDKLTARERAAGRLPAGYLYRLPTEAEWEYCCRAGTTTRFGYGDDPGYTQLADYAWYSGNSPGTTHPVGQKKPNPWGLYDMHGNVWEWCLDWYSSSLPGGSVTDPRGPGGPSDGSFRVYRGGGWRYGGGYCRSAFRARYWPSERYDGVGFRPVLAPGQ